MTSRPHTFVTSPLPPADQINSNTFSDDDEEEHRVLETDPTGRYERYATCLGKGAYKEVFKAYDQEEGVEVAWNQLKVDHLAKRDASRYLSEIQILQGLRHDNILNLLHAWITRGSDGKEKICFITELMTSGTLKSYIKKTKGTAKPKVLRSWCRQILSGLEYLHSRKPPVIHRDLKGENIFINGNNGQAKIGDLGLATFKDREHISSVLGTPEFMAPELYDEKYDEKVDIYAFGMLILEIVTREYPYSECTNQAQIYKKVSSGIKPAAISRVPNEETKQFIELCIQFDPTMRPSASELLKHPFLNSPLPSSTIPTDSIGTNSEQDQYIRNRAVSLGGMGSNPNSSMKGFSQSFTTSQAACNIIGALSLESSIPSDGQVNGFEAAITSPIVSDDGYFTLASDKTVSSSHKTNSYEQRSTTSSLVNVFPMRHASAPSNSTVSSASSMSDNSHAPTTVDTENYTFKVIEKKLGPAPSSFSDGRGRLSISVDSSTELIADVKMNYAIAGRPSQEIRFPFNLQDDTPSDVVSEMVKEHLIQADDEQAAIECLEGAIENLKSKNLNSVSATSETIIADHDRLISLDNSMKKIGNETHENYQRGLSGSSCRSNQTTDSTTSQGFPPSSTISSSTASLPPLTLPVAWSPNQPTDAPIDDVFVSTTSANINSQVSGLGINLSNEQLLSQSGPHATSFPLAVNNKQTGLPEELVQLTKKRMAELEELSLREFDKNIQMPSNSNGLSSGWPRSQLSQMTSGIKSSIPLSLFPKSSGLDETHSNRTSLFSENNSNSIDISNTSNNNNNSNFSHLRQNSLTQNPIGHFSSHISPNLMNGAYGSNGQYQ